jgi:hypothetical protein
MGLNSQGNCIDEQAILEIIATRHTPDADPQVRHPLDLREQLSISVRVCF